MKRAAWFAFLVACAHAQVAGSPASAPASAPAAVESHEVAVVHLYGFDGIVVFTSEARAFEWCLTLEGGQCKAINVFNSQRGRDGQ